MLRSWSKTKSVRLKVPSERVDLSHTGMCGVTLRSTNHLSRTINSVACEPLWSKVEAAPDAVHHGLCDGDLRRAVGTGALGVDDDSGLVVDEVVRIIGKKWVHARPGNPCRLRIGQRDFSHRVRRAATSRSAGPRTG